MINNFNKQCVQSRLLPIYDELLRTSKQVLTIKNGNRHKWEDALNEIKEYAKGTVNYKAPYLNINAIDNALLQTSFKKLIPWRKGPYQIGNLKIDSEWRCDMKWDRVFPYIQPLQGKTVLDVGAGNGYFTYLMALSGAQIALGIEPFLLFNYQFKAIHTLISNPPNAFVLPLKLEQMPKQALFNTVFSMGVLYHQKDHLLHLQQLKSLLLEDGELILETLVIDKKHGEQIIPKERYARMRNVWCLPSTDTLYAWLQKTGFKNIKLLDVTKTTPKEQRATHWIGDNTQSIKSFLDPHDSNLTVEGLPAPLRAIFICKK